MPLLNSPECSWIRRAATLRPQAARLAAFAVCAFSIATHPLCAEVPSLKVVAAGWRPEMSLGGPVALKIGIENLSGSDLVLNLGEDEKEGLGVVLRSSTGRTYSSKWAPKEGLAQIGTVKIKSGEEISRMLILQDLNIFPEPGTYDVTISFKYGAKLANGEELVLAPLSAKVTVVGHSAQKIKDACDSASSSFLAARDYSEASMTARLLARFSDESALPCLTDTYYAATNYHFEDLIIDAIGNIGTSEAESILRRVQSSGKAEDARLAGNALEKIRLRSEK